MTQGIQLRGVSAHYGDRPILRDVSLSAVPGDLLAVLGRNGAGKSTLLKILAGLLTPSAGEVVVDGDSLSSLSRHAISQRIAVVMDPPEPVFAWTAIELVLMGRAPRLPAGARFEGPRDREIALDALQRVDALPLAEREFGTLSAGERQRVLLARALAQETDILLLDEPTSHLDPAYALRTLGLLRELASQGRTVVAVVHDLNLAGAFATRCAWLHEATILAAGPPAEMLTPERVRHVFDVGARRIDAALGGPPALVFEP